MDDNFGVGKIIAIIILAIVMVFGIVWAVQGTDFFLYKVFAPKMEQVRRETFEQSKAYNQGVAQDLESERQEYIINKDKGVRAGLRSIIFHKLADYDINKLSPDLQQFVAQLHQDEGDGE